MASPERPATVRLAPDESVGQCDDRDIICHVILGRDYTGGERQTELLIRGLANWKLAQRVLLARDAVLATRLGDLHDLDIREIGGSAFSIARHAGGCALLHAHDRLALKGAVLRKRFFGTPYVMTCRSGRGVPKSDRRALRNAAAVVAVSTAVADSVKAVAPEVQCRVIPDAASALKSFDASAERLRKKYQHKFLVGHVGALDHDHKGQFDLLTMAAELARTHPQIQFVLVGDGHDDAPLRERAKTLSNVDFAGFVDNVGDYLAAFDVFVMPSLYEGLGSVLLDAMDFALPIVATRVGGIPEIVKDNDNGLLVEASNPDQLRYALLRVYDDAELRARLGAAGRRFVQDFAPANMVERYLDVYQPLLGASSMLTG